MPVRIREWTQRHFTAPNRAIARPSDNPRQDPNTVETLSALYPDYHTGVLKRGPTWTAAPDLPSGISDIAGAFYDVANERYCLIGENSGNMVLVYTTTWASWLGPYTILSSKTLGGKTGRNVSFWGGYLWVINEDGDIYRGTDYTAALASFYASSDAQVLAPMNDRLYGGTDTATVLRLRSDSTMGDYHDPVGELNPVYLTPFRQYLTVVSEGDDVTIDIFRLPDYAAHGLHQLGRLPSPGILSNTASPFALYDDRIWMLTGRQAESGSTTRIDVYAFDGHRIRHVAWADGLPALTDPDAVGLFTHHNRLILYNLDCTTASGHTFLTLVGDGFADYAPLASVGGSALMTPFATGLGDYMICTAYGTPHDVYYARRDSLQDGYVELSRLDMGHPGLKKRLARLTVVLDGAATNFDVILKYRVDDASAWTTAKTQDNTRIVIADDLAVEFYLLQIRIDLDDDTGNDEDIGIAAVSAVYSVNE